MKQVTIPFEQVHIGNRGNNLRKSLFSANVAVSSREIFLGDSANWKVKWKDLVKFEVGNRCLSFETLQKTFELVNADDALWLTFQLFVQKQWDKLQGVRRNDDSMNYVPDPIMRASSKSRPKREYGTKASRHKRILQSAASNSKIGWSDDEDVKERSPPIMSPQKSIGDDEEKTYVMSSATQASDDEMTLVMSDDDVPRLTTKRQGTLTSKQAKTVRRRIVKKMADSDSDDDRLFDEVPITTPITNRLVTPHAAALDDDHDEQPEQPEDKRQGKLSDFFAAKPKPASVFFKPKPKGTNATNLATTPHIESRTMTKVARTHTPLKADHLTWIERTPTKTTAYRPPTTPEKSPFPASPVDTKSPSKSIARHFAPPKERDPNRDSIVDSDDDQGDGSHKRLRLSRKKFVNRSSVYGRSKADSVLDSASFTPRKIPFGSLSPESASRHKSPKEVFGVAQPPPPPPIKWKGLRNLGNTCYLNSSLQLLCTVSEFCNRLIGQGGIVTKSLAAVVDELQETTSSSVNPRQLKDAIDAVTDRFSGNEQRDAHEFLSDLIDRVHDETEETKQDAETNKENQRPGMNSAEKGRKASPALTDEFFRMDVQACLKCDSCGYARTMDEMYRHLSIEVDRHITHPEVEVRPTWSVNDGLKKFFQAEQRDVKCEKCEEGTTATQTLVVSSQPKALILQLKRFIIKEKPREIRSSLRNPDTRAENMAQAEVESPPVEMIISKNKDQVVIPESFDLGTYTPQQRESFGKYKLSGIVHHHGSTPSSGHYTTDAVRGDGDEVQWVSFDDGTAYPANISKLLKSPHSQRTAYLLLYTLVDS